MKYLSTILLSVLFALTNSFAQIEYSGKPLGPENGDLSNIPFIKLKSADLLKQVYQERLNDETTHSKVDKFGESVDLALNCNENGRWLKVKEDLHVWQIGMASQNASSLGIILSPFRLKLGAKLFIYTPDGSSVRGAFIFRNNKKSNVFAISPIKGDSLIIELQVFGKPEDYGELVISSVGVGFPTEAYEISEKDGWFGWSAECETDINCVFDKNIQRQKYSVCRVLYNNTNRCTGALINNTRKDGAPFVLTGGHCIKNESDAESAIFAFDYESPYCEGPDGKIKSISGSTILSHTPNLDFTLVQMSEIPPANYYPVYAGWDATGEAADYTYVPHHPEGDVKKISIDYDSLWTNTFAQYDRNTHWLIPTYELGTTENGSSGAPLFDTANRIVGTLSGGGAVCSEYIFDYYQKFSHCWRDYPADDEQLKAWLDPDNTGALVVDNYFPIDPAIAYSEELSNIDPIEGVEKPYCTAYGWMTGHNADGNSNYVEHYFVKGSKYIYAVWMDIARSYFTDSQARFTLKIWEGNSKAEEIVYEKDVYLFELKPDTLNYISLDTMILVNGNFFVGYEVYYRNPADTFAVKMVYNPDPREINTAYKLIGSNEGSSYFDPVWDLISCGNQTINTSLAIYPVVFNYYISKDTDLENFPLNEVTLYPNPAYDHVQILFKLQPQEAVTVKVYDLNGQIIDIRTTDSPEPNIRLDTSAFIRGMYVLRIDYSEGTVYRKLLIL
jgi:lysyl endopeptidase